MRRHLAGNLCDPQFMSVVRIGVEQGHGQGLDPAINQLFQLSPHRRFVQGHDDLTIGTYTFISFDRQFQRGEWRALVPDDPAAQTTRYKGPGDLQHVLIAFGRNQSDQCA